MKSATLGVGIFPVEVTNVDSHGIWVLVGSREYFLSYEDFPWFKEARLASVLNVELHHGVHLYWPALDVDLSIESLECPDRFPLVAEK